MGITRATPRPGHPGHLVEGLLRSLEAGETFKVPTGCGRTGEPPNEHLQHHQHYYLKQGFTYVRTVLLPHNPS